jgi:hypothetical protein
MGDSDPDGAVADAGRAPVMRVLHAAKAMLPNLRIILAAMIATCVAVVALSAGVVGTRELARNLSGVPDLSRTLVRQAVVDEPEWLVLAYSRRADELQRLRDLPVTPVRAVVEYAEQAQARAAEAASVSAAPSSVPVATAPAAAANASAPMAASEPAPTVVATVPVATPAADAPPSPAADSAAVIATPAAAIAPVAAPPADTSAATAVATATVATPPADTPPAPPADTPPETAVATAPVITAPSADAASAGAPVSVPTVEAPKVEAPAVAAPTDTVAVAAPSATVAAPAPAASDDAQVATVQTGSSETAEMYGPEKPKAKKRHGPKAAHAHVTKPKKKAPATQAARTTHTVAPVASTGFPVGQPNRPSNAFTNWRANESTPR